jgi:hypothetical protein
MLSVLHTTLQTTNVQHLVPALVWTDWLKPNITQTDPGLTYFRTRFCPTKSGERSSISRNRCHTILKPVLSPSMLHLISNKEYFHVSDITQPAHSSHPTVPNFFLWGYFKECLYKNCPQVLKHPIQDKITNINQRAGWPSFWQSCESYTRGCW